MDALLQQEEILEKRLYFSMQSEFDVYRGLLSLWNVVYVSEDGLLFCLIDQWELGIIYSYYWQKHQTRK